MRGRRRRLRDGNAGQICRARHDNQESQPQRRDAESMERLKQRAAILRKARGMVYSGHEAFSS